jgi:hypothetical protein
MFKDDQLSRAFPTKEEVWKHAFEAGLIEKVEDRESSNEDHLQAIPRPVRN